MPKVQVSQFMEQNKKDFDDLRNGAGQIKHKMEELDSITSQLKAFFTKMDFQQLTQTHFRDSNQSKEAVIEKIFDPAYKMIQSFNEKAKNVQSDAGKVGDISINLNKKNKGDDSSKK